MVKNINRRIAALEGAAEREAQRRARYAPFSTVYIQSILNDVADLVYHPRGLYGGEERTAALTITEAVKKARAYKAPIRISMIQCPEWFHALVMSGKHAAYTPEQLVMIKAKDLEQHPEISRIYDEADPAECIRLLSEIPQNLILRENLKSGG